MLFEDAQWSDPTSLELYDLIIDRAPALSLLLIVTFRPEFTSPWTGRPHVTSLGLNRLAPRQRAEMIAGVTGGKALPPEIAHQIIDRTDGVPLFVEELTKAVVESGMLADMGDRYTVLTPRTPLQARARELTSMLNRPRALCFALWGQIGGHYHQAELHPAQRLTAEMRELGDATGDVVAQVVGLFECGCSWKDGNAISRRSIWPSTASSEAATSCGEDR
jgi:hypothetical protein